MDLFEMLEDNYFMNNQNDFSDYKKEYCIVLQNYGIEALDVFLEELVLYYFDFLFWVFWVK